jgi:hypothetical protein
MGAEVDKQNFASKMQDPTYAENVRQALIKGGADVSDSGTFYNSYGKAQAQQPQSQQPVQDPLFVNSDTNGQMFFEQDAGQDATSKQQQGMGDPFATTPPDFLKRALFSAAADIEQHPIKAALNIGSLAIPMAGDYQIARSALSPIVKGLASAAINGGYEAARSKLANGSVDPLSTGISTLAGGLGGFIGGHLAGKAVSNADDLAARQAALQAQREAQGDVVGRVRWATPPEDMRVLPNENTAYTWTAARPTPTPGAGPVKPQQQLDVAKQYMASTVYGNKVAPSSISNLDAAKWMTDQEATLADLYSQSPELKPLIRNYYNELAPTDAKSIAKKNIVNQLLNPAVDFVNRNQQAIGKAGSLFSGLTPLAGSLSDYAIHKVAGN